MKKLLLIIFSAVATLSASAQKAEEIIEKYFTAIGGIENCRKIQSIRVEGYYQKKHQKTPFINQ
jgi:hypothetical protein